MKEKHTLLRAHITGEMDLTKGLRKVARRRWHTER